MKQLTAAQTSAKALDYRDVFWLVKIDWPAPYSSLYYSGRDFAPDPSIAVSPIVTGFSAQEMDSSISFRPTRVTNETSLTLLNAPDDENRIELLVEAIQSLAGVKVTLYCMFDRLSGPLIQADWINMGVWRIHSYDILTDRLRLNLRDYIDFAGRRDVGFEITRDDFPSATQAALRFQAPIIFGNVNDCLCPILTMGKRTNLRADIDDNDTIIPVENLPSGFPTSGSVIVGSERISFTQINSTFNAMTLGNAPAGSSAVRGASGTTRADHSEGSVVREVLSTYQCLVAWHHCVSVSNVRINGILIPASQYSVSSSTLNGHDITYLNLSSLRNPNELSIWFTEEDSEILADVRGLEDSYQSGTQSLRLAQNVIRHLIESPDFFDLNLSTYTNTDSLDSAVAALPVAPVLDARLYRRRTVLEHFNEAVWAAGLLWAWQGGKFVFYVDAEYSSFVESFWTHNASNYAYVRTDISAIDFVLGGNVCMRIFQDGTIKLRGELIEMPFTSDTVLTPADSSDGSMEWNAVNSSIFFGVSNGFDVIAVAELLPSGDLRVGAVLEGSQDTYDITYYVDPGLTSNSELFDFSGALLNIFSVDLQLIAALLSSDLATPCNATLYCVSVVEQSSDMFEAPAQIPTRGESLHLQESDLFEVVEKKTTPEDEAINRATLYYARTFVGEREYGLKVSIDDEISQALPWGLLSYRLFSEWIRDPAYAESRMERLIEAHAFKRTLGIFFTHLFFSPLEIGDHFRVTDERSRLFGQWARVKAISFPEPDLMRIVALLQDCSGVVWRKDSDVYITAMCFPFRLLFHVGGALVARLDSDGILHLLGEVVELPSLVNVPMTRVISSNGLIEAPGTTIIFGVWNAALSQRYKIAELDASGNLTVQQAEEVEAMPYSAPTAPSFVENWRWIASDASLHLSVDKTLTHLLFERIEVAGILNATMKTKGIIENATL